MLLALIFGMSAIFGGTWFGPVVGAIAVTVVVAVAASVRLRRGVNR